MKKILEFTKKTINFGKICFNSKQLKINNRKSDKDFTRNRQLTFEKMIVLMLMKGIKSLQLRLNEFTNSLTEIEKKITASAFTQARQKISYTAFIELNKKMILDRYYDKGENEAGYITWNGYRILVVDGSKLKLPEEKKIKKHFGEIKIKNKYGEQGSYTGGLLSVLYDPINNLAIDSLIEKGNHNERVLAIKHVLNLEKNHNIEEKDLIIFDRGYYSAYLFQILLSCNKDFVCRITKRSYNEAKELFDINSKINSKIITIKIEDLSKNYNEKYGLNITKDIPKTLKIRLVRVVLDNGEIEVLATSLLDEVKYKNEIFKDLYFKRWGIEVYYNLLKNRLALENFSGKNVESIKQDLFSTIFLSNLETIITRSSNEELSLKSKEKNLKNRQQVNKQISFNTIKNSVIDLFLSDKSTDEILEKMFELFKTNPTQKRKGRKNKRIKLTSNKQLNYQKRKKKHCF